MSYRSRSIQARLLNAFEASRLTYDDVGRAIGCTKGSAHRKLNGRQRIDTDELEVLVRLLGLELELTAIRGTG